MSERAPWGDFPEVQKACDLKFLQAQPEYELAKSGDGAAAFDLATRLIDGVSIANIRAMVGRDKPIVVPVAAVEGMSDNQIPVMMAAVIADNLGLEVDGGIKQTERVKRTKAGANHRLAFNPSFQGNVVRGAKYLIVDDNMLMGGTIASLRGYIENRGGKVLGAFVMSGRGAMRLPATPEMIKSIFEKHGPAMDEYWKAEFGYGIDQLTQSEAGHLRAAESVDSIRERIATARRDAWHLIRHPEKAHVLGNRPVRAIDQRSNQVGEGSVGQPASVGLKVLGGTEFADRLFQSAQTAENEQQAMLESASVEQTYQASLALYVQAKHAQIERIEDRLESLVDRQSARLQQMEAKRPGRLALPSTRRTWHTEQSRQRARLQTLQHRLQAVREIRDDTGLHSPKIEELATRKMRIANPELASDWDAMREAMRRNETMLRNQAQEQKKKQHLERARRGQKLNLKHPD